MPKCFLVFTVKLLYRFFTNFTLLTVKLLLLSYFFLNSFFAAACEVAPTLTLKFDGLFFEPFTALVYVKV